MYITRVYLEHIRCFRRLEIKFDELGSSALIVGDNGDGKSTLLRCIAMGLCDESSAAALHRELLGDLVRHRSRRKTGKIEISLAVNSRVSYRIETSIEPLANFETVKQKVFKVRKGQEPEEISQKDFPWKDVFVSGYGAGMRTIGTQDFNSYQAVDAVYTLFVYTERLQNPELVVRRLIDKARKSRRGGPQEREIAAEKRLSEVQTLLAKILNLKSPDQVLLTPTGIEIKGLEDQTELGALGDGYKATITWLLDLLSWWFLHKRARGAKIIPSGIVLIDEIEQHLHPRWQIGIMRLLRSMFPKLQIIATTHSPLVISGSQDVPIHRLDRGEHRILNASGWLAEDVYRDVMGMPSSRDKSYRELIEEYRHLDLLRLEGKASPSERERLRQLVQELKRQLPQSDPVLVTTKLKILDDYLRSSSEEEDS